MALNGVVRGKRRPPRVVLYGPPGVGKTTFGSEAANPILIMTEDGADNLENIDQFPYLPEPGSGRPSEPPTWNDLLDSARQVATGDHNHKTVVVDTLNGAAEICAQMVCKAQFGGQWVSAKGKGGFNAFAQGWQSVSEEMRALMALLDQCRNERGMMVILLAHSGLHNVIHPTDGEYMKFAPDVDKRVWARWSKWSDIILRADYDYFVRPGEAGRKGRAELGDTTRWAFSVGNAAQDAKTRVGYELPERMLLGYQIFADALNGGDESTLEEVKALWPLLQTNGAEAKALAYLGVASVADLHTADRAKVRATLNRLRQLAMEQAEAEATSEDTNEPEGN